MNRQDLDSLHEKASGLYLQGDHQGALEAWQALLEIQPDDERALEGIRLCEQMAGGCEETVFTPGQSPFAVGLPDADVVSSPMASAAATEDPSAATGVADAPESDFQDALDELDVHLDLGTPEVAAKEQAPAQDGGGFLDLSDLAEEEEDVDAPFGDLPEAPSPRDERVVKQATGGDPSTWTWGGSGDDAPPEGAALELRRRVNEMLANALVAYEGGRKTQALKTLDRLLAIDEENDPARTLREKIAKEIGADPAEPVAAEPAPMDPVPEQPEDAEPYFGDELPEASAPQGEGEGEDGDEVSLGEPLELADLQDAPPTQHPTDLLEPMDAPEADDGWNPGQDQEGPAGEAELSDDVDPMVAAPESSPSGSSSKTKLLMVMGLVLVAAVGWQGWRMFNSPTPEPVPEPDSTPALDAFLEGGTAGPEPTEVEPGPAQPVKPDPSAVISAADKAFEEGNYSLAVIRYGEALKIDPQNVDAKRRLKVAGERYRARKEVELQWERVLNSFQSGDYANALRILYRLPESEDPKRIDQFKTAAWYNLGLDRLKAADCPGATTNFKEARELSPDDRGVAEGLRMARMCASNPTPAFAKTVANMPPRGFAP